MTSLSLIGWDGGGTGAGAAKDVSIENRHSGVGSRRGTIQRPGSDRIHYFRYPVFTMSADLSFTRSIPMVCVCEQRGHYGPW